MELGEVEGVEQQEVSISCEATGNPPPRYNFYKVSGWCDCVICATMTGTLSPRYNCYNISFKVWRHQLLSRDRKSSLAHCL